MTTPLAIAIVGANGRMGRFAQATLAAFPEFTLRAGYGSADPWPVLLSDSGAQIGLDLTVAGRGVEHATHILQAGCHAVIGTSGMDPAHDPELDRLAKRMGRGCLIVPNFSLGAVWLQRFAEMLAPDFPEATIYEQHGPHKRDAPSGTALETQRRMLQARDPQASPIPIHSARLPGVLANQSVCLEGTGESLAIRHAVTGPEAYGPGLRLALQRVAHVVGVERGLDAALHWKHALGSPGGASEM